MTLIFFTDRDLGKQVPAVLRAAGLTVERHIDHFEDTTKDEEWLSEVGRRGWFALTHNSRIRYMPNERDAVMLSGVGLFILIGQTTHLELAENFVVTIQPVEKFIKKNDRPFIAKVYRPSPSGTKKQHREPGRVELWLSYDQWLRIPRR